MKILYIGVHSHTGWGAEYWLTDAFKRGGHKVISFDYRRRRKQLWPWSWIARSVERVEKQNRPDIILLQRAEKMPPTVLRPWSAPVVFWSTEPIRLKNDVDQLLAAGRFGWVYVHSHGCYDRIKAEFPRLLDHCSVLHNACPRSIIEPAAVKRSRDRFAVFNRRLSPRRRHWLQSAGELVTLIQGKFGEPYFNDLATADVAVNIHYSDKNTDDFETGIFEAMAKGCVVISERLHPQTVAELGMEGALLQVDSPPELARMLTKIKNDEPLRARLRSNAAIAIRRNTWDNRARQLLEKFETLLASKGNS